MRRLWDFFNKKVIEEGYVLAVNKANPVQELSAAQIKDVFDEEITNWKELGGPDAEVKVFRLEDITSYFSEEELGAEYEKAPRCIGEIVAGNPGIIAFVPSKFIEKDFPGHLLKDESISFDEVFAGKEWFPTATPAPQFGFLPLITGTLWVSFFAILFALPFGLSVAVYMSEVADHRTRSFLKPVIELLSGIPSVVYGFFGLIVIVPLIQKVFNLPVGETGLAGSIVLAIMALPTIITVSEDAMRNCPRAMREASLALGATRWQTIYKVVIPFSIFRNHFGRCPGHRTCHRRDDGGADGYRKCGCDTYHYSGTASYHSGDYCSGTGRGTRRRRAL